MASTPTTPVASASVPTSTASEHGSVPQVVFNDNAETEMMEKHVSWYRNRSRILDLDNIKSSKAEYGSYRLLDLISTLVYNEEGIDGISKLMSKEPGISLRMFVALTQPRFGGNAYLLVAKQNLKSRRVSSPITSRLSVELYSKLKAAELKALNESDEIVIPLLEAGWPREDFGATYFAKEDDDWTLRRASMRCFEVLSWDESDVELASRNTAWAILQILRG